MAVYIYQDNIAYGLNVTGEFSFGAGLQGSFSSEGFSLGTGCGTPGGSISIIYIFY